MLLGLDPYIDVFTGGKGGLLGILKPGVPGAIGGSVGQGFAGYFGSQILSDGQDQGSGKDDCIFHVLRFFAF